MKLFLFLAIISIVNNVLITYDSYNVMVNNILRNNFIDIIRHSNLFSYFKYVFKLVIYWIFFHTGRL